MLKFLKISNLYCFTLLCLLWLSLRIFPKHSWTSFHQSSPDFKGAFMFYWQTVLMNGSKADVRFCLLLTNCMRWAPEWTVSPRFKCQVDIYCMFMTVYPPLWGKAPKRTWEHRKFCWLLCLGAALALSRVLGSQAKRCGVLVSDLKDKPAFRGSPCHRGAASALNHPVTVP